MRPKDSGKLWLALWVAVGLCGLGAGCRSSQFCSVPCDGNLPRELDKTSLPAYVIEPPDILLVDAVNVVPKPPYRIEPNDALFIQFPADARALSKDDLEGLDRFGRTISGTFNVEPEGTVNLGPVIGSVSVTGLSTDQARTAIEERLRLFKVPKEIIDRGKITVTPTQSRATQQIRGEHLVRPDGTISLGTYGGVYVTSMTLAEAKEAVERHLSQFLLKPEVSIDVFAYNSKVSYVIMDGAASGQQVYRLPITGNETVLDVVSQVNGLSPVSSKRHIWVARPSPEEAGGCQVLPVDWIAITENGSTKTNYQILPGDRVFVQGDRLIAADTWISKIVTPMERVLGFALLGRVTVRSFEIKGNAANTGGVGGF